MIRNDSNITGLSNWKGRAAFNPDGRAAGGASEGRKRRVHLGHSQLRVSYEVTKRSCQAGRPRLKV